MSLTGECFDKVFGLSRTTDDCFGDPPVDYADTASGLFLDEAPGLNLQRIMSAVQTTAELWELMEKARSEGVSRFTSEVSKHIQANSQWRAQPMSATMGSTDNGSGTVKLPRTYHGMDILLPDHRGGEAILNRIGMFVKFTGTVTVSLYEEGSDTPLDSWVVNTTQNKLTWTNITPVSLSMTADGSSAKRYWLLWEPGGQQALNSRIHCGCGGTPNWSCSKPWWSYPPSKSQEWYSWAMANGTYGDNLSDRENWAHNNATQGMLLGFVFKCDGRTSICSGSPDYEGDAMQSVFAYGSRFAAALYLVETITGSTRVNRENIAAGDDMELRRVSYMKEMNERAEWLGFELSKPENINRYSDCFACKDEHGLGVSTIRR